MKCKHCEEEFIPKQKFCSVNCRVNHSREPSGGLGTGLGRDIRYGTVTEKPSVIQPYRIEDEKPEIEL